MPDTFLTLALDLIDSFQDPRDTKSSTWSRTDSTAVVFRLHLRESTVFRDKPHPCRFPHRCSFPRCSGSESELREPSCPPAQGARHESHRARSHSQIDEVGQEQEMRGNFPQGKAGSRLSGSQSFPYQMCTWKPNFFRFLFPRPPALCEL